jgi:xylulose-5-phosphate/fructose-6-phosphate phosphoketolase
MVNTKELRPNPAPDPSLIPDSMLSFRVELDIENYLPKDELHAIQAFRRAANYIAAGS